MLSDRAEFRALVVKDIVTASDSTRKVDIMFPSRSATEPLCMLLVSYLSQIRNHRACMWKKYFPMILCVLVYLYLENCFIDFNSQDFADFVHFGRWTGNRNSCNTL